MNKIVLSGCRPEPLSSYLKALAVLRLVSQQRDATAKGWWENDAFVLYSHLDKKELLHFFVEEYSPTPIVSPWNGGSGFYENDRTVERDAIIQTTEERFKPYREVIELVQTWMSRPKTVGEIRRILEQSEGLKDSLRALNTLSQEELNRMGIQSKDTLQNVEKSIEELEGADARSARAWLKKVKKAHTECTTLERNEGKAALLVRCRSQLPEECLPWFDTSLVLCGANSNPSYNPLLGSGGNDGRLDFSNNFMQWVANTLVSGKEQAMDFLQSAFFAAPFSGLPKGKIGQFDPGRSGGYNQGSEVETKDFKINPWNYLLTMEGACALTGSAVRRSRSDTHNHGAIPFTVSFSGVGFSSSDYAEEGRCESWLPLWRNPATYGELRYLLGEGRSTVGRRPARNGLEFVRAVGSLGVDRGIDGFTRYMFLERKGKSYVALPAGRLPVRLRSDIRLIDELDPILEKLDRKMGKNSPISLRGARRRIDEALYACLIDDSPARFQDVVIALGKMEHCIATLQPEDVSPLSGLSMRWISQCDDGGVEVRIAAALASIRRTGGVGPIGSNIAGVDAVNPYKWATGLSQHNWLGNSLTERLGGVLQQRMMDFKRLPVETHGNSLPKLPLDGMLKLVSQDVLSFLLGQVSDRRIEELLWGFLLIRWSGESQNLSSKWRASKPIGEVNQYMPIPRGWSALKLLHSTDPVRGQVLRYEGRIIGLMRAGRMDEAVKIAVKRLRVSDLNPLPVCGDDWIEPERQLAALLIPMQMENKLESLVLKNEKPI